MKKKIAAAAAVSVCCIVGIGIFSAVLSQKDKAFITIEGEPVSEEEFQMILREYQAQVQAGYTTDEANSPDFWEQQEPLEQIVQLALDDLTVKKTEAAMAKEAGLEVESDYDEIVSGTEAENEERSGKKASGEVVYGLESYTVESYYTHLYQELEFQLTERLKQEIDIADEELREIYGKNKDIYTYEVGVDALVCEFAYGGAEEDTEAVAAQMREGKDMEELQKAFPDMSFYELSMNSLDTQEGKSGAYAARWETAAALNKGEVSNAVMIGENVLIIRCEERKENTALDFDTVKGVLESQVKGQRAQEQINERVEKAEIKYEKEKLYDAAESALKS